MSVAGVGEDLLLQGRVAADVRGRVYAAHIAAVQLSLAVPLLFSGFVANTLGPQAVYGLSAGSCGCGVLALATLVRRARATPRVAYAPRARSASRGRPLARDGPVTAVPRAPRARV